MINYGSQIFQGLINGGGGRGPNNYREGERNTLKEPNFERMSNFYFKSENLTVGSKKPLTSHIKFIPMVRISSMMGSKFSENK